MGQADARDSYCSLLSTQVVGAGYSLSAETGDVATLVKLLRVAMLLPVILVASLITRAQGSGEGDGSRPPLLPWFAVAFAVLVALVANTVLQKPLNRLFSYRYHVTGTWADPKVVRVQNTQLGQAADAAGQFPPPPAVPPAAGSAPKGTLEDAKK